MKKIIKSIYLWLRAVFLKLSLCLLSNTEEEIHPDAIKRVMIIRLDRIGDLVLSMGFIRSVRELFPNARITLLVADRTKDLLKGASYVDSIEVYSKDHDYRNVCDVVFDLISDYTLESAVLAFRTKARYRIGFDVCGRGVFFNMPVKSNPKNRHFIDHLCDLLRVVDPHAVVKKPQLSLDNSAAGVIEELINEHNIKENDCVICFHPGGYYSTQRWDPMRFAQVADEIAVKYHAVIIMIGSADEMELIGRIQEYMKEDMIAYVGQPLDRCVALIKRAQLFIGNNSGILHMACALEVPTISTMGPTNAKRWWPLGEKNIVLREDIPCIGCGSGKCLIGSHDCMNLITVEEMLDAVKKQMSI